MHRIVLGMVMGVVCWLAHPAFAGCPAFPEYRIDVIIKSCEFSDVYRQSEKTVKGMMVTAEVFDQEQAAMVKFHEGDTVKFFVPSERDVCAQFKIRWQDYLYRFKASSRCPMAFDCVEGVCDILEILPETFEDRVQGQGFEKSSPKILFPRTQSYDRLLFQNSFGMFVGERVIYGESPERFLLELESASWGGCPEGEMCIIAGYWNVRLKISADEFQDNWDNIPFEVLDFGEVLFSLPDHKTFNGYSITVFQPKGRKCLNNGQDCYIRVEIRKSSVDTD